MLFRTLLSFITIIFSTHAYVLPKDLSDGTYLSQIIDGIEVHKKISDTPTASHLELLRLKRRSTKPPTTPVAEIFPRQLSTLTFHCACGQYMDHGNTDAAVGDLQAQLGDRQSFHGPYAFYSIRGSVVAFWCVLSSPPHCVGWGGTDTGQMYGEDLYWITRSCGWYVAGAWTAVEESVNCGIIQFSRGYMNYYPGLDFCARSIEPPATGCF